MILRTREDVAAWARRSPSLRARLDATPTLEERAAARAAGGAIRARFEAFKARRAAASKAARP